MSSQSNAETFGEQLQRLKAECCTCERCGHVQAEPNWCHRCRHRTTMPDWARDLLEEVHKEREARLYAESALDVVQQEIKSYYDNEQDDRERYERVSRGLAYYRSIHREDPE